MTLWVPLSATLAWVGLFVHNLADLPGQTILSPESIIPLLITSTLVALWFTRWRRGAAWALMAWGLINLVGAILTVLPLTILPFDPEQSLVHYGFHLLYGLSQLPIIITTAVWIRRHPRKMDAARDGSASSTRSPKP